MYAKINSRIRSSNNNKKIRKKEREKEKKKEKKNRFECYIELITITQDMHNFNQFAMQNKLQNTHHFIALIQFSGKCK